MRAKEYQISLLVMLLSNTTPTLAKENLIPEGMYRKDQPITIQAQESKKFDKSAFQSAYRTAGQPKIVLLWNKELSDRLRDETLTTTSVTSIGGNVAVLDSKELKVRENDRRGPAELINLKMRSAFSQGLVESGIKLVDRNVSMRQIGSKSKSITIDKQSTEIEALASNAQLMMEVLNTADNESPTGWATYISIKRLSDGTVLTEGYVNGAPDEGSKKYIADPRGGFIEVYENNNINTKFKAAGNGGFNEDIARPSPQRLAKDAVEYILGNLTNSLNSSN